MVYHIVILPRWYCVYNRWIIFRLLFSWYYSHSPISSPSFLTSFLRKSYSVSAFLGVGISFLLSTNPSSHHLHETPASPGPARPYRTLRNSQASFVNPTRNGFLCNPHKMSGVLPKCSISLSEKNSRKVNRPVFSLWIVVNIVLRNPFESLHPVPKHIFQGWSWDGPSIRWLSHHRQRVCYRMVDSVCRSAAQGGWCYASVESPRWVNSNNQKTWPSLATNSASWRYFNSHHQESSYPLYVKQTKGELPDWLGFCGLNGSNRRTTIFTVIYVK
jgi:hypothetical protein